MPVAVGVVALLLALVVLEAVVLVEQQAGLAAMELQTQEVGVVALKKVEMEFVEKRYFHPCPFRCLHYFVAVANFASDYSDCWVVSVASSEFLDVK